jgi:hypothetical protein
MKQRYTRGSLASGDKSVGMKMSEQIQKTKQVHLCFLTNITKCKQQSVAKHCHGPQGGERLKETLISCSLACQRHSQSSCSGRIRLVIVKKMSQEKRYMVYGVFSNSQHTNTHTKCELKCTRHQKTGLSLCVRFTMFTTQKVWVSLFTGMAG